MAIALIGELLTKGRTVQHQDSILGHAYIWRDRIQGHYKLVMIILEEIRCILQVLFERERYIRSPNKDDIAGLLKENKGCGFPGMLGSIDYLAEERASLANYFINGHDYAMGNYLAGGIYPP
ncbi:hypothetical protein FEM48_Zijuj06G0151700 [Ziziphus jujuba var. spinosa]|uniref:Uncharacterized protein n=1 Tax=Ziziphus jujuba var. spinosa TaxID=714518 RepID=A0A978VA07_ZIZJJ|nr:hypothetical protein FEM48_Zijuj06G0151700 [Ziziphus jujuba var. spinosa]